MKYKKYKIKNTDVFLIPIKKYKYTLARIIYTIPFSLKNKIYGIFLRDVIAKGLKKYPTVESKAKVLDELYDVYIYGSGNQNGDTLSMSFNLNFINDKYTEPNMLDKYLELLNEHINGPLIKDGAFLEEKVEEVRKHIKEVLENLNANPNYIADEKFSNLFLPNTGYSAHELGDISLIDKIHGKDLYEFYLKVLKDAYVSIYVCGDIKEKEWLSKIKKYLKLDGSSKKDYHFNFPQVINDKVKDIEEDFNTKQSIIYMGFKIKDFTLFDRLYVSSVFNYIFGGGSSSKLFMNIREKHSLCYSVHSSISGNYNVMTVTSRIDSKNKDKFVELVYEELRNMQEGKFDLKEVENGKHFYINAILSNEDSLGSMIDSVLKKEMMHFDLPEERLDKVKKISKEDIITLAKKIYPDTIYMLKGVEQDEEI